MWFSTFIASIHRDFLLTLVPISLNAQVEKQSSISVSIMTLAQRSCIAVIAASFLFATEACSVQGYCSTGCDMKGTAGPAGLYTSSGWTDTETCLDTLHVGSGCAFEVATGGGGSGRKYTYTESSCMAWADGPGYDKVRSIRVFEKSSHVAYSASPPNTASYFIESQTGCSQ